ncbi:hypothetical protein WDZ16_09145 [Pseudokineococcus marinus]|uniref:Uncharacterized protein n=1 Tax=Pseudokineococcus marinus TaxID=351215 RepID=A0A849BMA5_9ACTN|nr:hypothetical protein [Pseudokineococcus marinus]NNH22495.1 hypothetical protein [Pseudokineococcus marinus]
MNPVRFVRALPQPAKAVYTVFFVALVVAFALVFALRDPDVVLVLVAPGALMVVVGLLQVFDVNGTATRMASFVTESRPLGVDYSRSVMATPRYVRLVGLAYVLIGLFWCALALGLVE